MLQSLRVVQALAASWRGALCDVTSLCAAAKPSSLLRITTGKFNKLGQLDAGAQRWTAPKRPDALAVRALASPLPRDALAATGSCCCDDSL